jgi:hypothetical protein
MSSKCEEDDSKDGTIIANMGMIKDKRHKNVCCHRARDRKDKSNEKV